MTLNRGPRYLIGPHFETFEGIRTERRYDRDIGGIPPPCHQDTGDPPDVIARIECIPAASEINLDPRGEIADAPRRRSAHISQISRAIASRNVHAAAECDGEMRIVPAHSDSLFIRLRGTARSTRTLIVERDVLVDVVADRLHAPPAWPSGLKQSPGCIRQKVRLAITA